MKLFGLMERVATPAYCVFVALAAVAFAARANAKAMVRQGMAASNVAISLVPSIPVDDERRLATSQCFYEWIGSHYDYSNTFHVPDKAVCKVDCSQGDVTWTEYADGNGYTQKHLGCSEYSNAGKTGIRIVVSASNFRNLKVTCQCPAAAAPSAAPPAAPSNNAALCFWEGATVEVLNKGEVTMKSLEVGDLVLNSEGQYEAVYSFAHQDKISAASYIEISFWNESRLKITPEHLVLVEGHYIPAKSIQVGSLLHDGKGGTVEVKKIRNVEGRGLYAPLTPSGALLVDGVQTSCYISLQKNLPATLELGGWSLPLSQHMFAHILLSPIRMACLGISSKLCTSELIIHPKTGYAWFVDKAAFPIVEVIGHSWIIAALLSIVFGTFWILECLVGASWGPLVVFLFLARLIYSGTLAAEKEAPHAQQKAARKRSSKEKAV